MKPLKRIFLTIIILSAIGFLFRGWLYRHIVTYKSVGLRNNYTATNEKFTDYIDASIAKQNELKIEQIIKLSLSITSWQLNYTVNKNDNDPNKLINSKRAHCVGYASFFSTTCNYLLKKYAFDDLWIVRHHVGQLYFLGTNVHQYFHSPFFKNHDFVTIENKATGEMYAVDPTINDYLWIDFVTLNKGQRLIPD